MTSFSHINIKGVDRKADVLRAELTRTVNAIGNWEVTLRNIGGVYNSSFDVQDDFLLSVNGVLNVLMRGKVDGPAVTLRGRDLESIWDEYTILKGVDQGQDLLFHNDFEYDYPLITNTLDDILDDVFNTQLGVGGIHPINITYTPIGGTPTVGAFTFREGASFISQIQELMNISGYVFYVDDALDFKCAPSTAPYAVPAPSTYINILGDVTNNILGSVDYQTRDGDKHYNWVKLYGKSPMFDGWTEYNAASWTGSFAVTDDPAVKMVGGASIKTTRNAGTTPPYFELDFTGAGGLFNYTTLDFTKGEVGAWVRYDGADSLSPKAIRVQLYDGTNTINYYSGNVALAITSTTNQTQAYKEKWSWIAAPLGVQPDTSTDICDHWWPVPVVGDFDWEHVSSIRFSYEQASAADYPDSFWIDGISIPIPIVSVAENVGAQGDYLKRPYIDSWPHVRTQNALDKCAQQILGQSESTIINKISFVTPGTPNLIYAGQSINMDIPSLGITPPAIFYITKLHHIIEPMVDVSKGYGFDWVTEIEALPTTGISYDQSRLRAGSLYSPTQLAMRGGVGSRSK